jgi:hypothetical protein
MRIKVCFDNEIQYDKFSFAIVSYGNNTQLYHLIQFTELKLAFYILFLLFKTF